VVLKQRFRYVDDLVKQKWVRGLTGNAAPVLKAPHSRSKGLTRPMGIRPHCHTDPALADTTHSRRGMKAETSLSPSLPAHSLRGVWQ